MNKIKKFESYKVNEGETRVTKLDNGRFYLIEEDGGDQLSFVGLYNDLNLFIKDLKSKISHDKNIPEDKLEVSFEKFEAYPGSQKSDVIVLKNNYSKSIFHYSEIGLNELNYYSL